MAEDGNIRYLRYILLLGEGVLLVLRGITRREVVRTGATLEAILTIPSNRGILESNSSTQAQRLHLYPSGSTVNADIDTWDISLLTLVLQRLFWSNFSRDERLRICYLRDNRNEFQGHPPEMSMDETDYATRSADLISVLQDLASGLDQHTRDELTRIINNSSSVDFNYHAAINSLQQLYEFKEEMIQELRNAFEGVNRRLDTIQDETKDHKQLTRDIGAVQSDMYADLLDTKSLAEENKQISQATSETVDVVKETALSSKEIATSSQEVLRNIERENRDHGQMTIDIGTVQGHMHGDLLDTKSLAEENNRILQTMSGEVDSIKDEASKSAESNQEKLANIEKMLKELMQQVKQQTNFQQDVDANINIKGDRQENATEAQNIIVSTVNDILKQIRPDLMGDSDNSEAILQQVNELLSQYESSDYELTKALLKLMKKIWLSGSILGARKGSVKLRMRFTSYRGCLHFIQYLNSKRCQDCLKDISHALTNRTGHVISLSADIAEESLFDLHKHLVEECENHRLTRTVLLPVQCKGITNLNNIWNLLQKGGADKHTKQLSEILTKMVGGNVTVTTSVDMLQFEQALRNIEKERILQSEMERLRRLGPDLIGESMKKPRRYGVQEMMGAKTKEKVLEKYKEPARVRLPGADFIYRKMMDAKPKEKVLEKYKETERVFIPEMMDAKRKEKVLEKFKETERGFLPGAALIGGTAALIRRGADFIYRTAASIGRKMMEAKPKEKVLEKYKECREQLTFKQIAMYPVTDKTDIMEPCIAAIALLPDGRILLADFHNENLKMLDSSFKLVSSCDLPQTSFFIRSFHFRHASFHIRVCYIGKGRVAVSSAGNGIQIVNVSDGLVIDKFHELHHTCFGLACYGDILYISDQNSGIYTYSTEDIRKRSFHKYTFYSLGPYGRMYPCFNPIAISDDGEKIYIGSHEHFTTVDNKGHILSILETDIMKPTDMCVAGDGTVLVCDFSGDILRVDYEGKNILKAELSPTFGRPRSLCFNRKYSRLIVGGMDKYIHVFEVQK